MTTSAEPTSNTAIDPFRAGKECLDAALEYLKLGWASNACCTPDHKNMGQNLEKWHSCANPGKRPWHKWKEFQERRPTEDEVRSWWKKLPASNVGIFLGPVSGIVRIDVDGPGGEARLLEMSAGDLPATLEFTSGRANGGRGLLYAIPNGVKLKTTAGSPKKGEELRFQARGAQTVLPPSRHPNGGRYAWASGHSPFEIQAAPMPQWLVDHMQAGSRRSGRSGLKPLVARNGASVEERAIAYLAKCEPAVSGQQGHAKTLWAARVVVLGCDLGVERGLSLLLTHYNPTCDPPWTEAELRHKCEEADTVPFDKPRGWLLTEQRSKNGHSTHRNGKPPPHEPGANGQHAERDDLPYIIVRSDEPETAGLKILTPKALAALGKANHPEPHLFTKGNNLVRLRRRTEECAVGLELLTLDSLRGELDRSAHWGKEVHLKNGGTAIRFGEPHLPVVRDILALSGWDTKAFPFINHLAESPRFLADGRLVTQPGYYSEAKLFYDPPPELVQLEFPASIREEDVEAARSFLLANLLADFPFADRASKAHALACMLQPFVRMMIPGPVPFFMFSAPTEGTGKGLLADVCAFPSIGHELESTPQKEDNAEWRKAITSALMTGRSHVYFDNMFTPMDWKRENYLPLDSAALAAALTQAIWSDRVLGGNREVQIPIRVTWMGSGNNVEFSPELARRVVSIRLEPTTERPWERDGFKHPDLRAFARENRKALLLACLTLCQHWINEGRVRGTQNLGSYESWARVMGGILETAGVVGFLENKTAAAARAGDSHRWPLLCELWYAARGSQRTTTAGVYTLIADSPLLSEEFADILGEGGINSQKKRLGKAIANQEGRVWANCRVTRADTGTREGCVMWVLKKIDPAAEESTQTEEGMVFE
jgi:hypothetical protein